ncbi:MAG: hypothetical protein IKA77_05365 [Clostridia bacterium]|nr:hypothetical protein [Clostridia bacterium]
MKRKRIIAGLLCVALLIPMATFFMMGSSGCEYTRDDYDELGKKEGSTNETKILCPFTEIKKNSSAKKMVRFTFNSSDGYYYLSYYNTSPYDDAVINKISATAISVYLNPNQSESVPTYTLNDRVYHRFENGREYYACFTITNNNSHKVSANIGIKGCRRYLDLKDKYSTFTYTELDEDEASVTVYDSYIWESLADAEVYAPHANSPEACNEKYIIYLNRKDVVLLNYLIRYPDKDLIAKTKEWVANPTDANKTKVQNALSAVALDIGTKALEKTAKKAVKKAIEEIVGKSTIGKIAQMIFVFDISMTNNGTQLIREIDKATAKEGLKLVYGDSETGFVTAYPCGVKITFSDYCKYNGKDLLPTTESRMSVVAWKDARVNSDTKKIYGAKLQPGKFNKVDDDAISKIAQWGSMYDIEVSFAGIKFI